MSYSKKKLRNASIVSEASFEVFDFNEDDRCSVRSSNPNLTRRKPLRKLSSNISQRTAKKSREMSGGNEKEVILSDKGYSSETTCDKINTDSSRHSAGGARLIDVVNDSDQSADSLCPVCTKLLSADLTLREKEIHINSCLDGKDSLNAEEKNINTEEDVTTSTLQKEIWEKGLSSKQVCQCGKNLSKMDFLNAQAHLYKCKSQHGASESTTKSTVAKQQKTKNSKKKRKRKDKKDCPICLKLQCNDEKKFTSHLKQCAAKYKVSTSRLLCLLKDIQWFHDLDSNKENSLKMRKRKKVANSSSPVLVKYCSELKETVVQEMKQVQASYKLSGALISTPAFKKSRIGNHSECNIDIIRNTGSRLWTMSTKEISVDHDSFYLSHLHQDLSEILRVRKVDYNDQPVNTENLNSIEEQVNENNVNTIVVSSDIDFKNPEISPNDSLPYRISSNDDNFKNNDLQSGFIKDTSKYLDELQIKSSDNLTKDLCSLFENSFDTDFIFHCQNDVDVNAHCLLLLIRCDYLKQIITKGTKEIDLSFIPAIVVRIVLKFLYTGLLPLDNQENIDDIYKLSTLFGLENLKEFCTLHNPDLIQTTIDVVCSANDVGNFFQSSYDSQVDEVGNDSCFSDEELDFIHGIFLTQSKSNSCQKYKNNIEEEEREECEGDPEIDVNEDICKGKEIEDRMDTEEFEDVCEGKEMEDGMNTEEFDGEDVGEGKEMEDRIDNKEFDSKSENLSSVFFNDSLELGKLKVSKEGTILDEHNTKVEVVETKSVTVLVSDSETDPDETLDVDPFLNDVENDITDDDIIKNIPDDFNGYEMEPINDKSNKSSFVEQNLLVENIKEVSTVNNLLISEEETMLTPNEHSQVDKTQENSTPEKIVSQLKFDNINSTPNKMESHLEFDNINSSPNKIESQSILVESQGTPNLDITTHSPVAQSFGTPFLSGKVEQTMDIDEEIEETCHPLDQAEATVIDENAYEKLNNFLRETHKENKNDVYIKGVSDGTTDQNLITTQFTDTLKDKNKKQNVNCLENCSDGYSIDFQVSEIDVPQKVSSDVIFEDKQKNTKDLLLGSNSSCNKNSLSSCQVKLEKLSSKSYSHCSDESVSSGDSKQNIHNFISSRSKRRNIKKRTQTSTPNVALSSDDDLSETELLHNTVLQRPSQKSSGKKLIKTYSISSPLIYEDNSWLSSKDSPKRRSRDHLTKMNLKKKKNSFKEMVIKQQSKKSSTDESISDDEEFKSDHAAQISKISPSKSICCNDQDSLIDGMFKTDIDIIPQLNNLSKQSNRSSNISNLLKENQSEIINEKDISKDDDDNNVIEEVFSNRHNDSIVKNDSFNVNSESYFMDDGGYNSFAMGMNYEEHCLPKDSICASINIADDGCFSNDIQSGHVAEEGNESKKLVNSLMGNSSDIDNVLVNFMTPSANDSCPRNSKTFELNSVDSIEEVDDCLKTSTPLNTGRAMTEECKQAIADACKNFRPGSNLHPETNEPITPMPDYSSLPTPKLKDEMKKIALRNIPKHKMIAKMKEVYKFQHDFMHWEEEAKKKPAAKKKAKTKDKNSKTKKNSEKDDIESVNSEINLPSLDEQLMKYISSHPQLQHNILTFNPLEFNDLFNDLKSSEIKCSKKSLELFLDKQCICYYTAKDEIQSQKPKRKRKKGKL